MRGLRKTIASIQRDGGNTHKLRLLMKRLRVLACVTLFAVAGIAFDILYEGSARMPAFITIALIAGVWVTALKHLDKKIRLYTFGVPSRAEINHAQKIVLGDHPLLEAHSLRYAFLVNDVPFSGRKIFLLQEKNFLDAEPPPKTLDILYDKENPSSNLPFSATDDTRYNMR